MSEQLQISNVPVTVPEAQIRDLLAQFGVVEDVARIIDQKTQEPRESLTVTMQNSDDIPAAVEQLNGYLLEGRPLYVFLARPPKPTVLNSEARQFAQDAAERFKEDDETVKRQIIRMVQYTNIFFTRALLQEALAVEEAGGLMVTDGSRRRTPGGVFFFLARRYLPTRIQRHVLFFNPELRKPQPELTKNLEPKTKKPTPPAAKPDSKTKKPPKAKDAAHQPQAASPKPPTASERISEMRQLVVMEDAPAEVPKEITPEVEQEFHELKQTYEVAQQRLLALQQQPSPQPSELFSASKDVWQIEAQIKSILKLYPDLS